MLSMLANLAIRRPRQMLLLALAVFLISAAFGATAIGLLNARNPFSDPSSASARAEQAIKNATGLEASPGVLALVSAPPGTPAVQLCCPRDRGRPRRGRSDSPRRGSRRGPGLDQRPCIAGSRHAARRA